ncbi:MAG: PAS domain-containing protein, partial [Usitatibacteraceae bacterium]
MNAAKILLVDSDATSAAALQQQLRALDTSVVDVAMDGAQAIGTAWQLRPEVIVIEYPLPGEIDTRLVIQTIRSQLSPVVVLITESSLEEVSAYADDLAPFECLQKPFSARELQMVITLARYKRQAEAKLATAMQRLQGTQLGTRDAFWDRDLVKQEVYYSYRWFEMIGYAPDELPTTMTLREELTHPDDRARVAKLRSEACAGNARAYEYEMRLRHKAGHYVPVLVRGAIMRDAAGKAIRMSGANTDLSQEKRLQGELEAQRDFATLIVETMGQGLSVTDANGRMEFVNTALARLCGRETADLVGRLTEDIIVTEDRASQATETVQRRSGARSTYEIRLLRPDGSSVPVEVTAVPRWRDGNFAGAIAVVNDLTERKRAEAALLASEEQLKFALEATHDGLWDWNIQTGEVHLSPQGSRLLGYESGEITPLADMFYALVHPEDTELLIAQGKTHLAAGTPFMQCEIRLRMKDGEYRWFLDRGKVVSHDAIGKPLRMVGTITDITARKAAETALRESEGRYRALVEWSPEPIVVHRGGTLIY